MSAEARVDDAADLSGTTACRLFVCGQIAGDALIIFDWLPFPLGHSGSPGRQLQASLAKAVKLSGAHGVCKQTGRCDRQLAFRKAPLRSRSLHTRS